MSQLKTQLCLLSYTNTIAYEYVAPEEAVSNTALQ